MVVLTIGLLLLLVTPAQARPVGIENPWDISPQLHKHKKHHHKVHHQDPPSPVSDPAPAPSTPTSFRSAMACISIHEEYGVDGPNTSAGYFGFVYPPSSYVEPGPSLAAQYGDSWTSIPLEGQYAVAYALYQEYGWSPWSTAGMCGLG